VQAEVMRGPLVGWGRVGQCSGAPVHPVAATRCIDCLHPLLHLQPSACTMLCCVLQLAVSKCSFGTVCFAVLGVAAVSACNILGVDGEGGGFMHSACRCQLSAATWRGLVRPTRCVFGSGTCSAHGAMCQQHVVVGSYRGVGPGARTVTRECIPHGATSCTPAAWNGRGARGD
jgi:hypothetical protein